MLVRERSAIATLIVSRRDCLCFCRSVSLSDCPHSQNASSPAVLVGISYYFNAIFSYVERLSGLYPRIVDPDLYDVINIMKFSISEISNDDISGTGRPINFVFDSSVGFSGTADRMDLLPVGPNPRGGCRPSWKISNDHIFGNGYPIHFHELDSSFGGI